MNNTIDKVVQERRCMSCGMCQSSCPLEAIDMRLAKDGFFRPSINRSRCVRCGRCLSSCPAECQSSTSLVGVYKELFLAHSYNSNVRHAATSGGAINSLLRFLLDKKIVEAALMVRSSEDSTVGAKPVIISKHNVQDLLEHTREYTSMYVQVPVLTEVQECLRNYKKIAVVGTPCQIKALNYAGGGCELDIFKIGITCSGGMSYKATEEYKRSQKMEVSKMYYRGDGWPGKNCLIQHDNRIEYNHQHSMFERMFSSQIFKNPGCRYCTDHFAEDADVSFCDFWNQKEMTSEREGNSCVIIRSDRASKIFSRMQDEKYISTVRKLTEKELIDTQWHVLLAKKGNVRNKHGYHLFMRLCDFVLKHKIYKFFGMKMYCRFCKLYSRICKGVSI